MDKKDALIIQILAHASSRLGSPNRITAPENMEESVRSVYEEAEKQLQAIPVHTSVSRGRGFQKVLTWNPDRGLLVHDAGPSGVPPHWREENLKVLLMGLPLIPQLLDKASTFNTRAKSENLEAGAAAVLEGVNVALFPEPAPVTRKLTKEEEMPKESPSEEVELEEPEDSEAFKLDAEEEEEEEDDSAQEILGTKEFLEEDPTTEVPALDMLLPPTLDKPADKP